MSLKIIRGDITTMACDAIVNATNHHLYPGGGVDLAIHKAAGEALFQYTKRLGGLDVGSVKIAPGYNLPCKFVIHTVGPRWQGGNCHEHTLLRSCYIEALTVAKACKCQSIAFPLIASGAYGYPKEEVVEIALDAFKAFLNEEEKQGKNQTEMQIYLVIYDGDEFELREELKADLSAYIDEHYTADESGEEEYTDGEDEGTENSVCLCAEIEEVDFCVVQSAYISKPAAPTFDADNLFKDMYDSFPVRLLKFIDEKGMDDVECYKKANVSKQTWFKILNEKGYKPSKKTVIGFALSLHLTVDEAQSLLAAAGFILSRSSRFDVIIMYCLTKKIYNVIDVNALLFHHLKETL